MKNSIVCMLWIEAKNSAIALLFLLSTQILTAQILVTGASQPDVYLQMLEGKRVALVANQTSIVQNDMHLVDFLLQQKVNLVKVFSPEHGFRGQLPDGEEVKDGKDAKSGLLVISLYGNTKKPTQEMLQGVDIVIFDIQDVGCRFYTYISTMTLVMEACAENNIPVLVFDRPNPNGFYIDGPVLQTGFESFVGMHKIPVVYGMTIGEYAKMVNGEKWLANGVTCDLQVIELKNYFRDAVYNIPVAPSPNLPNMASVLLYPSLCMFEGTNISVGRGTDLPFQQFGGPFLKTEFNDYFIPQPNAGSSNPPLSGQKCYGVEVVNFGLNFIPEHRKLYVYWLLESYRLAPEADKKKFFTSYFDKLAGSDLLQLQIKQGLEEEEIRLSWQKDIDAFKIIRAKYLLYPDF